MGHDANVVRVALCVLASRRSKSCSSLMTSSASSSWTVTALCSPPSTATTAKFCTRCRWNCRRSTVHPLAHLSHKRALDRIALPSTANWQSNSKNGQRNSKVSVAVASKVMPCAITRLQCALVKAHGITFEAVLRGGESGGMSSLT
jgi:hypothetical protein